MKNQLAAFGLGSALLLSMACESAVGVEAAPDGIEGTWVQESYTENVTVLRRARDLDDDRYGFVIRPDGGFIERKNLGWCGTPPVTYGSFDGTWTPLTDNVLEIDVAYWGGTMTYALEIVAVTAQELRIRYDYSH